MSSHAIERLVHEYGCALVFIVVALQALCLPLPGSTALIAAALYAATPHGLPIAGVIVAGALGALAGTVGGFGLGRWGGEQMLLKIGRGLRQPPDRVQHLRRAFAAHGTAWLFIGRFVTGGRNSVGVLAGASGMPSVRFVALSAAAAATWSAVVSLEYYWFGHAIAAAGTWLQIALVCAGVVCMAVSVNLVRRSAVRRIQRAESAPDLG